MKYVLPAIFAVLASAAFVQGVSGPDGRIAFILMGLGFFALAAFLVDHPSRPTGRGPER